MGVGSGSGSAVAFGTSVLRDGDFGIAALQRFTGNLVHERLLI